MVRAMEQLLFIVVSYANVLYSDHSAVSCPVSLCITHRVLVGIDFDKKVCPDWQNKDLICIYEQLIDNRPITLTVTVNKYEQFLRPG